jgi:hypothetical protein
VSIGVKQGLPSAGMGWQMDGRGLSPLLIAAARLCVYNTAVSLEDLNRLLS